MKHPIVKNALIFGTLAAFCCIAVALIQFYMLHVSPFGRYKAPAYGINVIFIFVAIWYYRIQRGGYLSFGEGIAVGFLTNFFAAFITGFVLYIFVQYVDSQSLVLWMKENLRSVEMMKSVHIEKFGAESYARILAECQKPISASTVFFDEITKKQLCIVAVSLISLILRRNPVAIS